MHTDLSQIIEEAYRLFKAAPPATIGVCECGQCLWSEESQELLTLPLRELHERLICDYNWAANLDNQPAMAAGLYYLLPRLLELIALGKDISFSDPVLGLRRLADIDFRSVWPAPQVDIIDRFYDAYLVDQIHDRCAADDGVWRYVDDIRDPMVLAVIGGADLDRLLQTFDRVPDPVGALQIANLRGWQLERGKYPRFVDAFLSEKPRIQLALGSWLMRPEHTARIEALAPAVHRDLASMLIKALT